MCGRLLTSGLYNHPSVIVSVQNVMMTVILLFDYFISFSSSGKIHVPQALNFIASASSIHFAVESCSVCFSLFIHVSLSQTQERGRKGLERE